MKGIDTLIKLHKRTLDDLRREMVSLENQKEQLQQVSAKLHRDLTEEMKLAGSQPDMARFFGDFAKRIQKRQDEIATEIRSLNQKIVKLNDKITEAFAELKKFEIAKENIKKRADEEARRKETIAMDEIASQQHGRKQKKSE